jgi:uncharacterized repeat protein (TIGR01451 family)
MTTSHTLTRPLLTFFILVIACVTGHAAGPGFVPVDVGITKTGPTSINAGDDTIFTLNVTNHNNFIVDVTVLDTLPAGWTVISATPSNGTCEGVGTGSATCAVRVRLESPVIITIAVHVPGICQPTVATNRATVVPSFSFTVDFNSSNNAATSIITVNQANLGAGLCHPASSQISGDKPGSILFSPLYISSPTGGDVRNNTRFNLTNVHPTQGVTVHLFFVDGATCSVADAFVCLTANQTVSFLMSDLDPGTTGFLMAIAVDGPPGTGGGNNTGCPISFNYLIGNANIKLVGSRRRDLDLEAESVASEFGSPVPGCNPNSSTAELVFDSSPGGYNRLPRVLAADNIPSRGDGNDTLLVLARVDGNYVTGLQPLGPVFGIFYDDAETSLSFTFNPGACFFRSSLSNSFPRTAPRFEQFIPAGRSGWLKLWAADEVAIIGAMHNRNGEDAPPPNGFEGGHNLHILRLLPRAVITVPVFPPSC